ncbi:Universal stress protein [Nonomuraea coxensis DSM 45129]|uniref:Universal stress protein n=1 Tax=Nonomuraea coxensis DSM 45129 TaxID=1122611 RepID=A0ABX8U0J6_9ACTN|nr:universal stress protein [Nonomuraea coxensis]QYC40244.1 Universal stress protein [Nonomuraea coxensis DSM 45129]
MNGHILVGVDGSAPATAAVEWAAADAVRRGLGLRLVHVCGLCPRDEAAPERCVEALATAGHLARDLAGGVEVRTELLPGNPAEVLIAESGSADSVVLGSRGLGGFTGLLVGSVGMAVAGHAAGPVVVVRGAATTTYGRVVAGYDGSPHSEAALQYAVEQARARGIPLHVVHAWQTPVFSPYMAAYNSFLVNVYQEETGAVAESVALWREKNPDVEITDEALTGHPVGVLARAGAAADLVVVGSRGLGSLASAVLGSVSRGVLHHVTCPVAVVRPR